MTSRGGMRKKLVTVMLLLVLSVLVLLSYWQITAQKELLQVELHKQTNLLLENLHSRALFQADQMKRKVEEEIASFRLFELTSSLTEITRQNEELEFIILTDHDNNIVVHTADASRQQTEYHDGDYPDRLILEVDKSTPMRQDWSDTKVGQALQNAKAIQYKMPVEVGNRRWG